MPEPPVQTDPHRLQRNVARIESGLTQEAFKAMEVDILENGRLAL
jgi:hypothetical protein